MKEIKQVEITHTGTIQEIIEDIINVRIVSTASCVSCSAKSSCSASEIEEKIIEVQAPKDHNFVPGDMVHVILNQSAGLKAVLLGYIFPFLVMFISLIITVLLTGNEGVGGLVALLMLIPYYLILVATKKQQKRTFGFRIKY